MFKVLFIKGKRGFSRPPGGDFLWKEIPWDEEVEERFADEGPDMVLLEVQGLEETAHLVKALKGYRHERAVPIMLVGGPDLLRAEEILTQVEDFLIEPVNPQEMKVRLQRILKRTYSVESQGRICCGDLVIDLSRREVTLDGQPLTLTFREYELLKFLAANRGRVFSREALLNKIWGYDYYGGERTVDVHIRRLRAKIEVGGRTFIETVRGVGYRFREDC